MITISKNSLHLLLGGLHLGSFKHRGYDPCRCENPLHSFKTEGAWSLDYFLRESLGENDLKIVMERVCEKAYEIAVENNEKEPVKPSLHGCINVHTILEVVEKMLEGGEIVVVD